MRTIGITGGTGFVGHHLAAMLLAAGHNVVIYTRDMHKVSRRPHVKYSYLCPSEQKFDLTYFRELDAVINLAGAGIADKRWTKARKEEIVNSRVQGTSFLVDKLKYHAPQCRTFISASAIGYYGADRPGATPFHEDAPPGEDFLGNTCRLWEQAAYEAADSMRLTILRFGIVLGREHGMFPQLEHPQRFGIVPMLGSGKQIISWIHISDLCRAILWVLNDETISGIYNAVAPQPVSQKQIMKAIAHEKGGIKLPVHVPEALLKIGLGQLSTEVLKSATVSSDKIQRAGFSFLYPDIASAIHAILHASDDAKQAAA